MYYSQARDIFYMNKEQLIHKYFRNYLITELIFLIHEKIKTAIRATCSTNEIHYTINY